MVARCCRWLSILCVLIFLHFYFRAFEHVLRQRTKPQFAATKENKLRNSIVEILHRLPQNQTLKEHVEKLLLLCTDVLKNDNELNALVALRVIFDVHKNFRPQLEDKLKARLTATGDDFASGEDLIKRCGYRVDPRGTVGYRDQNGWGQVSVPART